MTRWAELVGAVTLLTRLPVGRFTAAHPAPARCLWAYPLVGLIVGGLGAAVLAALRGLGVPTVVAAAWAVLATAAITGALHEDGLADTADGLGGGRTRERKLTIMRDSRIGSYGALAIGASLLLRVLCVAVAPHPALALLWSGALGRAAILVPLLLSGPARTDGLAAPLAGGKAAALVGLATASPLAIVAPRAAAAAMLAGLAIGWLGRRQLGGYTGDLLGAAEQAGECASLSMLCVQTGVSG